MRVSKNSMAAFGALALVFLAFPAFSQDDSARDSRAANPQLVPPVDPVPPNLIPADIPEELRGQTGAVQQPGNSYENRYRGVVAANVNSANDRDELIVDFGAQGVWVNPGVPYGSQWQQISGVNPNWIFSVNWGDVADDEIIGDFGTLGLWTWNYNGYPGDWTQLSGVNPDQGFAADDDGDGKQEIQIDFGTLGLWRYDLDNGSWIQYSALNPLLGGLPNAMWVTTVESGVWSFTGHGVWSFHSNTAASASYIWQLSGVNPSYPNASAELGIGDASEELVISFGAFALSGFVRWFYRKIIVAKLLHRGEPSEEIRQQPAIHP